MTSEWSHNTHLTSRILPSEWTTATGFRHIGPPIGRHAQLDSTLRATPARAHTLSTNVISDIQWPKNPASNVSYSATCRMTSRGINKRTPAYDLKRPCTISASSPVSWPVAVISTKVQDRHAPAFRSPPAGPCVLQAKSRKPQHIDLWKKWIGAANRRFPHHFDPKLTPFWPFTRIAQGPSLTEW